MRRILQGLNKEIGIKGSLVVGEDGLVVEAVLDEDLDGERVAAMASSTISSTKRALGLLGDATFERFILMAAHGRMVFRSVEPACLLVIMEKNINIDLSLLAIEGAARRIKNVWKM